jgi:hypothetical protein
MGGWPAFLEREGIDVQEDDCGRPAISRSVFGALIRERTSRRKLDAERAALRAAEASRTTRRRYSGVPAVEGRTPYESMVAADGGVITPEMEFGLGRERPRFLEEAIDAGRQTVDERRAEHQRRLQKIKGSG